MQTPQQAGQTHQDDRGRPRASTPIPESLRAYNAVDFDDLILHIAAAFQALPATCRNCKTVYVLAGGRIPGCNLK